MLAFHEREYDTRHYYPEYHVLPASEVGDKQHHIIEKRSSEYLQKINNPQVRFNERVLADGVFNHAEKKKNKNKGDDASYSEPKPEFFIWSKSPFDKTKKA